MSKPTIWMPLYVGDYLRDTGHLSAEEHGVYLLLIMHYWSTARPLPADDRTLAKLGRIHLHRWTRMKSTLSEFFKLENDAWHHERIERELIAAFDRSARGRRAAKARWQASAAACPSNARASIEHGLGNAIHNMNLNLKSENLTDAARGQPAETGKERLARLAMESRQNLLNGKDEA